MTNKENWLCKDGINYISVEESDRKVKEGRSQALKEVMEKIEKLVLKNDDFRVNVAFSHQVNHILSEIEGKEESQ